MNDVKYKVALLLGFHPNDAISMYPMFWQMDRIKIYPQLVENFLYDYYGNNNEYDCFVFYNLNETPNREDLYRSNRPHVGRKVGDTFYRIGEDGKGIVILHHAITSYPGSDFWSKVVGIKDRKLSYFKGGVSFDIHVDNPDHPITKGVKDWTMVDEAFKMDDCDNDNDVLLTTNNRHSIKTLAWTRKFKNSKIFCLQFGHDAKAFTNANFSKILEQGILWVIK